MSKKIVIIPTYNEKENVADMIDSVFNLSGIDILIVDDNSPDGTASIVKEKQKEYNNLFLLERQGKNGLGTAYIAGFKWALDNGYEYICEMDCDFSHPIHVLPTLFHNCENGYDVSIGSRYIEDAGVENWPKSRILISRGASLYVRMITGLPIKDTTSGFVCYKREVLERIHLDNIRFKGYAFQIEMKYVAFCLGFKLKEIPIIFKNRVLGDSKMSSAIFDEAFWGVLKLKYLKLSKKLLAMHKN